MEVDVPEEHANVLRTLCGLDEYDELPPKVVDRYWNRKRLHGRVSYAVTYDTLISIADSLGYGKPLEHEANPSILVRWRNGDVRNGTPVVVKWGKGERSGVLKGIKASGVIVQMEGDTEERQFAPDKVTIAQLATA